MLRIRDANGNIQEIIALKGEKGDAYVLTSTDKQEIAELALNSANIAYVGSAAPANSIGKDGDIYIVSG